MAPEDELQSSSVQFMRRERQDRACGLQRYTGWANKRCLCGLVTILLSNLNRCTKFFIGRFLGKFAVKWSLKITPHLAYVATLPCQQNKPLTTNDKVV